MEKLLKSELKKRHKLAENYLKNSNYQSAIKEYEAIAGIYKQQNQMLEYACANRMIGEAYISLELYDKALKHEEIYLNVAQQEGNKKEEQRALATIGHTFLTMSLCTDEPNPETLNQASKHFVKSLSVCEKLNGIPKAQQMDMMARLFSNLGVVKEAQGNFAKGIELVNKSVTICKKYDIFEQLERSYTTLSSLYMKSGDYSNAISYLNLAMEAASHLPDDKLSLTCSSLLVKADILLKMSDLQGAKRVLHKAYKLKTPNKADNKTIERNLKTVTVMSKAEESLLISNINDHLTRKTLYEKLGDGAWYFKNFSSAICYYKLMLESAIKNGESGKALSPSYVSLAQTYKDNKEYDKAIEYYRLDLDVSKGNVKESINTLFNILEAMELAHKDTNEIVDVFTTAQAECLAAGSNHELARVLERQILYFKKEYLLSEAAKLEPKLDQLNYVPSDNDSEVEESITSIGDDVEIDKLTDLSSSDDETNLTTRSTRKRTKGIAVKKNAKGETQLHVATIAGNMPLVAKLLEQGHVVNIRDHAGWLPIHEACICGHLDIVKMLVDKGAAFNDRGGMKCEGLTPLHDACSNGHLEIIEYLLGKGASPLAKTDNGETPLYFLKSWRVNEQLDPEEEALYDRLIVTMTNSLEKAGRHDTSIPLNRSNEALIFVEDNSSISTSSTQVSSTSRSRINRSHSSTSNNTNNSRDSTNKLQSQRTPTHTNSGGSLSLNKSKTDLRRNVNAGDDDFLQQSVTLDYKSTIDQLKTSCVGTSSEYKKRSFNSMQQSALMTPDEVDFDEWLEDDTSSNKKKRRVNLSLRMRTDMHSPTIISVSDNEKEMDTDSNDSGLIDLENCEPNTKLSTMTTSKSFISRKKKSQSTLLKSGFTRVRDSSNPASGDSLFNSNINSTQFGTKQVKITNFTNNDFTENHISLGKTSKGQEVMNELDINTTQSLIKNQMLFIDVRIDEKLFRIPFPAKDLESLTIHWLANETTKRFYKKEAMKPQIEMETKNGAILSDDDILSILFPLGASQCEELRAKVVKWNVPPLKERYVDACEHLNIETCDQITHILDATTVNLNLSDKNYREKLFPICRALNRQTNLYELNLSGNLGGNKTLEALCESLPSLMNLTILNLSTNHINSEGLSTLSSMFNTASLPGTLQMLKVLDLSFNPLGNESLKHIGNISQHLQLDSLILCAIDLRSGAISTSYNQNVEMNLNNLKVFDISYNDLAKQDLVKFLTFLNSEMLESLNLGNNSIDTTGFGNELFKFLRKNNENWIALKKINLSGCSLKDEDILELQRALNYANQLEEINLSFNNFTGSSLKTLLIETTPKRLLIVGCDNLKSDCDSYGYVNDWKFTQNRCSYLSTTFDYVEDFKQCEILISMFRSVQEDVDIQGLDEGMLKLSVRQ